MYGNEVSFNASIPNMGATVKDYDGNIYDTITIGTQTWMKQNLKTTHYQHGEEIPFVWDDIYWSTVVQVGAYCSYDNDTNNTNIYGRLYNYLAVVDTKNLCPINWHVPSDDEWTTLMNYLGGESLAGGQMKNPAASSGVSRLT